MKTDLDEINSIIEAADDLQVRLEVLVKRRTFSPDQTSAVLEASNGLLGIRVRQFVFLKIAFDKEYAEEMKKLTAIAKD